MIEVMKKNEINYSWMVEPGLIKNGNFLPVKYAFGVGHRNEYESKGEARKFAIGFVGRNKK